MAEKALGKRIAEWDEEGRFIGLGPLDCRWPIGGGSLLDMSRERFCAKPATCGSYCQDHGRPK